MVIITPCSSFLGSGLCVFSKYPIASVITHQFRVTGSIRVIHDGELFAGKGVLCCKIETPQGTVAVFNTHASLFLSQYLHIINTTSGILY